MAAHAHGGDTPDSTASKPAGRVSTAPLDPLFLLEGSRDGWSVSDTPLGCLLLSPVRSGGVRIALGRHATYGVGVFLIGLALSVPVNDPSEPVEIGAGGRTLVLKGRVVSRDLLFIPLQRPDLDLALRELWYAGTLWVTVRNAGMAQGGRGTKDGVQAYSQMCATKVEVAS